MSVRGCGAALDSDSTWVAYSSSTYNRLNCYRKGHRYAETAP